MNNLLTQMAKRGTFLKHNPHTVLGARGQTGDVEPWFSNRPCIMCGSLPGMREYATVIEPGKTTTNDPFEVCVDCVEVLA
jgi:hypothetical protein